MTKASRATPKPQYTLSSAEKTAILDDAVFYEILFALGVSPHDRTDYCAWEHVNFSRLGHARALIYFFECSSKPSAPANQRKKWDDDVISDDFGFDAADMGISQPDRERLNKDLFHISSRRLRHTAQTKAWPDDFLNRLHERAVSFIKFLLSDKRPADFKISESKWLNLLQMLENGSELKISAPFKPNGTIDGWLLSSGNPSPRIGLTKPEVSATPA